MLHRVLRPRRNHPSATPPVKHARRAFTLAELLIVVAIIGVLISILLPTLGAARRSANSAKCLAQMRDLGLAFQQYAQDNRRAFPIVEYSPPAAYILSGPARRSWQDYLVKYLHKRDPDGNFGQYKNGSPIWGCPAYDQDTWWKDNLDPATTAVANGPSKWNTGYGMHRYVMAPYAISYAAPPPDAPVQNNGVAGQPGTGNVAIVRDSAGLEGSYFKMEKWAVRAAERGLIADSNNFDIIAASIWKAKSSIGTGTTEKRCDPFMVTNGITGNSYINVDGARHMAGGSSQKKVFATKGMNMLFVDGHAAGVTPEEAWIAIRGGGIDARDPN
jgi:prepilin-type N-terminal cleavage/methylation domain-containing protein/prepilin-type processing-associated H-X9-DG protein